MSKQHGHTMGMAFSPFLIVGKCEIFVWKKNPFLRCQPALVMYFRGARLVECGPCCFRQSRGLALAHGRHLRGFWAWPASVSKLMARWWLAYHWFYTNWNMNLAGKLWPIGFLYDNTDQGGWTWRFDSLWNPAESGAGLEGVNFSICDEMRFGLSFFMCFCLGFFACF